MICQAILVTLILFAAHGGSSPLSLSNSTCHRCGNLTIPFPFGTNLDSGCVLDDSFLITCNYGFNPPKLFLNSSNIEVLSILPNGLIRVASSVATDCYDESGALISSTVSEFNSSRFQISSRRNKFTAVGCDTYALVEGSDEWKQMSAGCVSWCDSAGSVVNGTCSGIGCCQTLIPKGVKDFLVDIRSFRNHTRVQSFNPCGYAFVIESDAFEFLSSDLTDLKDRKTVPVVLEWSIGNLTCQEAQRNVRTFACRAEHSECRDSSNGLGYLCNCLAGFEGNPYLPDGCHDINECLMLNPCNGTCVNFPPGSYSCSCPKGFEGDGRKDGSGCHAKRRINGSTFFYVSSGLMVPAVVGTWIFWKRKQKKVITLRRHLFQMNGGDILENMLPSRTTLQIFTAMDLQSATNNYAEHNILLPVHQFNGTYYKGLLPDSGAEVMIKKCLPLDGSDTSGFIHNVVSLSQLHHRNVVKLIGCCLETRHPLLVYELVTVKTLYYHIHTLRLVGPLSWDVRLKIAAEIAGVLEYLHTATVMPIIHGNLNSSSILILNGYAVKVHEIGSTRFTINWDISGYSDPEYLRLGKLTVQSDVYSFGVILAELLTGKEVGFFEAGLAQKFVSSTGDERIRLMDTHLLAEIDVGQLVEVAKLALKCLSILSTDRPTMKEVAVELENARNRYASSTTAISSNSSRCTTLQRAVRRSTSF